MKEGLDIPFTQVIHKAIKSGKECGIGTYDEGAQQAT